MTGASPSALRLCTFNVHAWTDTQRRARLEDTTALLRALDCDVIVLQEVLDVDDELARLSRALGLHASVAEAAWGANAVLTRAAPHAVTRHALSVRGAELRSAVCVTLSDGPGAPLSIVGTHLDDRREDVRVAQLEALLARLATREARTPCVLAGDLNALRAADYTPAQLADIARAREQAGREPPRDDVVRMLDARGFVDAARRRPASEGPLEPLPAPLARTCWAGTRIDMVWLDAAAHAAFACVDVRVVQTDVSDHLPVVVELRARVAPPG